MKRFLALSTWRAGLAPAEPPRRVLALAWPSVTEQSLLALIALVDVFIIGHLGAAAIAAVGLGTQLFNFANFMFLAVGVGGTAVVARRVGAGNPREAAFSGGQTLLVGAGLGALAASGAFIFAVPVFRLLGGEPDVVQLGSLWLRIVAPSFIFSGIAVTGGAVLRGAGHMRASLLIVSVVNVVNVTLAWSLTRGLFGLPRLGVTGTAIGTSLGQTAGGVTALIMLFRGRVSLPLKWIHLVRLDRKRMFRVLQVGLPAGGEQFFLRLALLNMAAIVTRLGTDAYAAHIITIRLTAFSYLPGLGFANAVTTLVGQELGAGRPNRARESAQVALLFAVALMTLGGVVIYAYAHAILSVFISDTAVVTAGAPIMRVAALVQPIIAAAFVFSGALRGAGDTRATMLATIFSVWGLRVVLAYVLGDLLGLGLLGVWLAFGVDWASRAALFWLRFRAGKWQLVRV